MMKLAVATDGGQVSPHFGRCLAYTIIDIGDDGELTREQVPNPGHAPGAIPEFLHQRGVNQIICGGMGIRASELFSRYGIRTITGVEGSVNDVISKILRHELRSGESMCRPGAGRGYGLEKSGCDHAYDGQNDQ